MLLVYSQGNVNKTSLARTYYNSYGRNVQTRPKHVVVIGRLFAESSQLGSELI